MRTTYTTIYHNLNVLTHISAWCRSCSHKLCLIISRSHDQKVTYIYVSYCICGHSRLSDKPFKLCLYFIVSGLELILDLAGDNRKYHFLECLCTEEKAQNLFLTGYNRQDYMMRKNIITHRYIYRAK